jgi:hypothetical protein
MVRAFGTAAVKQSEGGRDRNTPVVRLRRRVGRARPGMGNGRENADGEGRVGSEPEPIISPPRRPADATIGAAGFF